MTSRGSLFLLLIAAMCFAVGPSYAQHGEKPASSRGAADVSPEVARRAASIARQTMSPFCPGRTLDDCPSSYAAEWRVDIREMVAKGMTAGEIQKELEKRAGGNLSGIPNRDSSYALPIALATAAALVLFLVMMRLRRKDDDDDDEDGDAKKSKGGADRAAAPGPAVDDDRLRQELEVED